MKPTEIINAEYQRLGKDPSQFLRGLNIAINKKIAIILQEGDTILILITIGQKEVELHLFTTEGPLKVARALSRFVKKIRDSDLKAVYGSEEPAQTLKMLETLGVKIEPSDKPKYKWMAKV
jgi:hypothetical protein